MDERFAVVFRVGPAQAAGPLVVEQDRLLLNGRATSRELELEIPFSGISAVRVGRRPHERIDGHPTLLLERDGLPTVRVAPLGVAQLTEIVELLVSLTQLTREDVLAVRVPLKPGCVERARTLLEQGPPLDPASLGLTGHEVYLDASEAVFVFRGRDVRAHLGAAVRHPAVWKAGLAWQRCFAGAPEIVDVAALRLDAEPAYAWLAPGATV